jgi:pyruvate/oxaloacetate carboxyltransferase
MYMIHLLKLLNNYNMVELINNLLPPMKNHYKVIGLDCLITPTTQLVENNQTSDVN